MVKNIQVNLIDCVLNCKRSSNGQIIDPEDMCEIMSKIFKKWIFIIEIGKQHGLEHYQCRGSLHKKALAKTAFHDVVTKTFKEFFKDSNYPESDMFNYWQPTTNQEYKKKSFVYLIKSESQKPGTEIYTSENYQPRVLREQKFVPQYLKDVTYDKLKPFQQKIVNYCKNTNDRIVILVLDPGGGRGKSYVMHYMRIYHNGIFLPYVDSAKELIAVACDICMARKIRKVDGIFIDVPRGKKLTSEFCTAIEIMKKGFLYDLRNHYKEWQIEAPPVIIACNTLPDMKYLSSDMWRVHIINDKDDLVLLDNEKLYKLKKKQKKRESRYYDVHPLSDLRNYHENDDDIYTIE